MAHGGHHGGGHYHSHYRGSGSSGDDMPLSFYLIILGIIVVVLVFAASVKSDIGGKKPIEKNYNLTQYVYDSEEYFNDVDNMREGLEYLYDKTGVQLVVMSSNEFYSDSKAVDTYYDLFDDECHVLIVIPTSIWTSTEYYAIGDIADTVIDDFAIDYLLDRVESSKDGEKWERNLKEFTDKLISEE